MARKAKIPNHILKRYERVEHKRLIEIRSVRKYYLIVCEGTKTEPNYFESFKMDLPKGVLTAYKIEIEGTGRNTQSLIDEALRLKTKYKQEHNRTIDKLWVVFDKDSFSAGDFNSAINRCKESVPEIGCAWSNEAFELWYLLHFHYYNNAISRSDYQRLIEENLKPHLGDEFKYEKNSSQMYTVLKEYGNRNDALRNAKLLKQTYEERGDYANHNPCTMVYELIEELLGLKEEIEGET